MPLLLVPCTCRRPKVDYLVPREVPSYCLCHAAVKELRPERILGTQGQSNSSAQADEEERNWKNIQH